MNKPDPIEPTLTASGSPGAYQRSSYKKETPYYLTPTWLRPFFIGGFTSFCLVMFVLFLVPSAPTTTTTTTTTTTSPSNHGPKGGHPPLVVAQAPVQDLQPPVIESETDGRPLPKLAPPTWFNPSKVLPPPAAAQEALPAARRPVEPTHVEAAKVDRPEKPFVPTPPYQRPPSMSSWADEALADPKPEPK